jgi:hypothetical protein
MESAQDQLFLAPNQGESDSTIPPHILESFRAADELFSNQKGEKKFSRDEVREFVTKKARLDIHTFFTNPLYEHWMQVVYRAISLSNLYQISYKNAICVLIKPYFDGEKRELLLEYMTPRYSRDGDNKYAVEYVILTYANLLRESANIARSFMFELHLRQKEYAILQHKEARTNSKLNIQRIVEYDGYQRLESEFQEIILSSDVVDCRGFMVRLSIFSKQHSLSRVDSMVTLILSSVSVYASILRYFAKNKTLRSKNNAPLRSLFIQALQYLEHSFETKISTTESSASDTSKLQKDKEYFSSLVTSAIVA